MHFFNFIVDESLHPHCALRISLCKNTHYYVDTALHTQSLSLSSEFHSHGTPHASYLAHTARLQPRRSRLPRPLAHAMSTCRCGCRCKCAHAHALHTWPWQCTYLGTDSLRLPLPSSCPISRPTCLTQREARSEQLAQVPG